MKARMMKRSRTGYHQFMAVAASSMYREEEEEFVEEGEEGEEKFRWSVREVERMLKYKFRNRAYLEDALTHSSFFDSPSYQRLEFLGDAALGLAISNFVFVTYSHLEPGQLSLLRSANISTEKLARVAVRHRLFDYVRHNSPALQALVNEFTAVVDAEGDDFFAYGGNNIKAPKVLADIVESLAAAIYVDCKFNLILLWDCFSPLLEPLVTIENLQQQPVTMLYELCQRLGKHVDIKYLKDGKKNTTRIMVDGEILAESWSEQKDISKMNAAKEALHKMSMQQALLSETHPMNKSSSGVHDTDGAKQKLVELCAKHHWTKPIYRIQKSEGPAHKRSFVCSVQVETADEIYVAPGNIKPKVKDAEKSAAALLLHTLSQKYGLDLPQYAS